MPPVTAMATSPASTRLHEIAFAPCEVSITMAFGARVMLLPEIVNPAAENAIDWTVSPLRSFVAAGRLDAGNEIGADASPAGGAPSQLDGVGEWTSAAAGQ